MIMTTELADLSRMAWLLGTPQSDSLAAIAAEVTEAPWLGDAVHELMTVPLGEWQAEHTRLFISGHPKTPCPPFASAYLEGRMQGQVCLALAADYARLGLKATGAAADYLGTILDCTVHLANQGQRHEAAAFFTRYLDPWLPRFCADLRQQAQLQLYTALGERLDGVLPPKRM